MEITKPVITNIEDLVKEVPGWTPIDQLYTLHNLVLSTSHLKGDVLEIGSWCGRSALILGKAAERTNAKVFCIDLFPSKNDWKRNEDGSYSFYTKINGKDLSAYTEQTVWKEPFERDIAPIYEKYNSVLDVFNEVMEKNKLTSTVIPHRGDASVLETSDKAYRVAFIDGDHSYEAVCEDIARVEKRLVSGGWICFDDAFSYYDGVNRAITDKIINSDKYELQQQMTRKLFVAKKK